MRFLIWVTVSILAFVAGVCCGTVFGWNTGRQNLVDEINHSRERLRRYQSALTYEEDYSEEE